MTSTTQKQLQPGDSAPPFELISVYGDQVSLADLSGRRVHLAFHRYASCPICNFSLRQFAARHDELAAAGITYLPVFHSPADKMREFYPEAPAHPLLVDPQMQVYKRYGLKPSLLAFFHPKALRDMFKAVVSILRPGFKFRLSPDNTMLTRPADFLIAADGSIEFARYGASLGDSMTVDEVLARV